MKRLNAGSSLFAIVAAAAWTAPARAQDQPPQQAETEPASGIQEIIVTAQKRSENVQTVPIAITAFTASAIKERAVSDVSQLSSIAPNVTLDASTPFSGSTAVLGASIRGIGSADFAFNIDQAVGVYLDGVYLGRSVGANQDLLDVERIEVLKGPQGTLFGRNTIGGAVSIVTHDPGKEFRFVGDLTTGSYRRFQVRGTVDIPLAEDFGASVTFGMQRRDGYQHRIAFPSTTNYAVDSWQNFVAAGYDSGGNRQGGENSYSFRGKLKYDSGRFAATAAFDYTNVDQESTPNTLLATTENIPGPFGGLSANDLGPALGFPIQTALDVITGSSGFLFAGLYNFCIRATPAQIAARNAQNLCGPRTSNNGYNTLPGLAGAASATIPKLPYDSRFITGDKDTTYANGNNYSKVKQYGVALTLEQRFSDAVQLKSISSYRKVDFNAGVDLDGSPLSFLQTSFTVNQRQWSQELQLNGSAFTNKLKYTFGAYYFDEAGGLHDYVTFADGLLQVDGPGRVSTKAYAAYGQVDWRIIDLIGITVGGRYTHEDKRYFGGQADDNGFNYKLFNCVPPDGNAFPGGPPCFALVGFPVGNNNASRFTYGSNMGALINYVDYYPAGPNRQKFNNFSPKAGVQIYPVDRVMLYGTWSRGYRSGGWTTRLSNPLPAAPTFGPEKAESFEVGLKSQILDRRLQLNLAAFTTRYQGIQLNQQIGVSPTVANLGNARVKGFEIEMVAAPSQAFTVNGSIGYLDAKYTYICGEGGNAAAFCNANSAFVAPSPLQQGIFAGAPLPKAPRWKFNLSPRLEVPVGAGSVVLLGDYTHTTRMRNDTEGTLLLLRPATDIVNASLTYRPPHARWSLTVGGTNLTNERYLVTGQAQIAGGEIYGTYNRPAEWYARLDVKF
jgi:iron complex outermembrane receptor protein